MKERQRRYRLRGGKEDSALPRVVPGDGSVVLSWVFPRKDGAFRILSGFWKPLAVSY